MLIRKNSLSEDERSMMMAAILIFAILIFAVSAAMVLIKLNELKERYLKFVTKYWYN